MLEQILGYINNWFEDRRFKGRFEVVNGTYTNPRIKDGQYFLVRGSTFNDGLHLYPDYTMIDEEFEGSIFALAIPPEVLEIAREVESWEAEHRAQTDSVYQSESFGGYSYTKATDKHGNAASWRSVFGPRLNRWRKL